LTTQIKLVVTKNPKNQKSTSLSDCGCTHDTDWTGTTDTNMHWHNLNIYFVNL
jgi:hypothetical protein